MVQKTNRTFRWLRWLRPQDASILFLIKACLTVCFDVLHSMLSAEKSPSFFLLGCLGGGRRSPHLAKLFQNYIPTVFSGAGGGLGFNDCFLFVFRRLWVLEGSPTSPNHWFLFDTDEPPPLSNLLRFPSTPPLPDWGVTCGGDLSMNPSCRKTGHTRDAENLEKLLLLKGSSKLL